MSSGLDCVECGGFINLERAAPGALCESCKERERADAEPVCETCEYSPGAIYQHASDCYDDEDGKPNLCSGTGVHYDDCRGRWIPCPECQEPEKPEPSR